MNVAWLPKTRFILGTLHLNSFNVCLDFPQSQAECLLSHGDAHLVVGWAGYFETIDQQWLAQCGVVLTVRQRVQAVAQGLQQLGCRSPCTDQGQAGVRLGLLK